MSSSTEQWRLPHIGRKADCAMPPWLVSRMMDGTVELNRFGGFTVPLDGSQSVPGDMICLNYDNSLSFYTPQDE